MKHKRIYGFIMVIATCLVAGCGSDDDPAVKKIPSLRETYSKTDKKPFGTYIAYRLLEEMFYRNTIRTERQAFNKTWTDIDDTASLYVCIAPKLFLTETEASDMLEFVDRGNNLFISASYIDENLVNKLGITQFNNSVFSDGDFNNMDTTATNITNSAYSYFYIPFHNYFSKPGNHYIKPVGVNESGKTNCIVYFHGRGKLFLHCEPRAFSNYFLLQKNNYEYMRQLMSYTKLSPDHVYWDDYYNKLNYRRDSDKGFSSLSEIMKHPPLKAAFWLTLVLFSLYILYGAKRRQRAIEELKPNENTSVTFTETIGRLYLQKKDNKNIADKMITYFNEYIRNNYFLNTNMVNHDFINTLSRKSGVPFEKVEVLYRTIGHAHNSAELDDYQLLSLNEQIQNFYKTRN